VVISERDVNNSTYNVIDSLSNLKKVAQRVAQKNSALLLKKSSAKSSALLLKKVAVAVARYF